ncbi:WecB/TagA/CpsF family glycosyltransferase [Janthinobacterium sp. B9-8]|uniref:WecB/TagA/CpsF family glycosyltransferase n=1 Tax=Janthinobacterium sp. B9-8 TaxID=1236179 RepID=UPI00061D259D|nr:WecB/TagA/CpsF family glycosyltransferase [Janthinobacterium sp. B9-8]AMC36805.1 teichoic acid biosynthesis protein [Janthinobacterium sp. B9-8]
MSEIIDKPLVARKTTSVLGASIDVLDWDTALQRIKRWSSRRESRYICICNAHSVVTTTNDPAFYDVVKNADMATSDGAPVAWLMRKMGFYNQQRINGPDLMWKYCTEANKSGDWPSIYLYGSSEDTLRILLLKLSSSFPALKIVGAYSPPFRALAEQEEQEIISNINASGAGVVWVSLGCPKQEKWMAAHRGKINAVMIGVGAAFDYHAGTIVRAPLWMQHSGLEWLHRLCSEPRRLWKRYFVTNTIFVIKAIRQLTHKN